MTYQQIKSFINTYIVQNGVNAITGAQLNTALNELADYKGFDSVVVTTLPAGSDATATVQGMTLVLGIPKGADGRDGHDGQDAVNPFKGWFTTDNIPTTGQEGDYCNVSDTSVTPHTVTIYRWNTTTNQFEDTGEVPDTATGETFASGETLQEVAIDDSHLENPVNSFDSTKPVLADAKDVAPLKSKLKDVYFTEEDGDVSNGKIVVTNSTYISGTTGKYTSSTITARRSAKVIVEGFDKVEFLGALLSVHNNSWGFAFYTSEETVDAIEGCYGEFDLDPNLESLQTKVYTLNIPSNAKVLRYTTSMSTNNRIDNDDLWVKLKKGATITEMIDEAVKPLTQKVDDISKAIENTEFKTLEDFSIYQEEDEEGNVKDLFQVNASGNIIEGTNFKIRIYDIDSTKRYRLTTDYVSGGFEVWFINYYSDDEFINHELVFDQSNHLNDYELHIPQNANKILMNVRKSQTGTYDLKEETEVSYYDFGAMDESIKVLDDSTKKNLKITVLADKSIRVRGRFDDNNDIMVAVKFFNGIKPKYNFVENAYFPRQAYIGSKDLKDSELVSRYTCRQGISDSVGPITMDWCGPVYANHGYSTPLVTITTEPNPLTTADVGSVWEDQLDRTYTIANIVDTLVYLLPTITIDNNGYPHREWIYYNSQKPTDITKVSGVGGVNVGTQLSCTSKRYDYQVCECNNFKIVADGLEIGLNEEKELYCNELLIGYQQICYAPETVNFMNGWSVGTKNYTPNFSGADIQVIFDRMFIFSGCKGYLSYTSSHKMNVLKPFHLGATGSNPPEGRYIGTAPISFLGVVNDEDSTQFDYDSYSFIPKIRKVYAGSGSYPAIDFSKEFCTNIAESVPVGGIKLTRNDTDLFDENKMPDRLYSYIRDHSTNLPFIGYAGGHSLVRGSSVDSVRNTMVSVNDLFGWWNPSNTNKLYSALMRHGNNGYLVDDTFIRMNEGFFCWYKPQLTNSSTGTAIHSFYYKSGNEYIVYIHTVGSHTKGESVMLPPFMDGRRVVEVIEQKNNNIQVLDDIVVANRIHIVCNANDADECNWIVLKIK